MPKLFTLFFEIMFLWSFLAFQLRSQFFELLHHILFSERLHMPCFLIIINLFQKLDLLD